MLNAKALGDLLTQNRDDRLCKRWFLMTPNGTLLAYSEPTHIKDLRKQAAMVATSWQEHESSQDASVNDVDAAPASTREAGVATKLHALTIETETANIILRRLQPQLLLALEGGVPRRKSGFEVRMTPERSDDARYPAQQETAADSAVNSSASSIADSTRSSLGLNILGLQRKKLDAMADAIAEHFTRTGFRMPDDDTIKLF